MKTPFNYQQYHLDLFASKQIKKLPLFWQMRLGKTPTTIWWLQQSNPKPERILILCPKTVISSWQEELDSFSIPHIVFESQHKSTLRNTDREPSWLYDRFSSVPIWAITNYECIVSKGCTLHLQPWDAVILDESVKIKNVNTQVTKILTDPDVFPLESKKYPQWQSKLKEQQRAILSGNPAPESMLEYFPQFKFLYGSLGRYRNFWEFRKAYFYTSWESPGKYIPKEGTAQTISKYLDKYAYVLTRKKLGIEIPNTYEKRFVELPPTARKIYDEFEENWFSEFVNKMLTEGVARSGMSPAQLETQFAIVAQSYLHQMACGYPKHDSLAQFHSDHKLRELVSLLTGELQGEKIVIWCQYLNDIKAIFQKLKEIYYQTHKINKPVVIRGGMEVSKVNEVLQDFRSHDNKNPRRADYLICQLKKASMGMDFSVANTQIFFSRSWSANENSQAFDRMYHPEKIGQDQSLLTLDIITENTIDEDLHHALIEKKANSSVFKWFLKRTGFDLEKAFEKSFNQLSEVS